MIKFWWQSGSRIPIRIQISTLVRRALGEVCTVILPSSFTMKQWLPLTHITPRQGATTPTGTTQRDYVHVDEKLHRYRRQNKPQFISLTQKVHNFGISATKINGYRRQKTSIQEAMSRLSGVRQWFNKDGRWWFTPDGVYVLSSLHQFNNWFVG